MHSPKTIKNILNNESILINNTIKENTRININYWTEPSEYNQNMFKSLTLDHTRLQSECEKFIPSLFSNSYKKDSSKLTFNIENYENEKFLKFIKNMNTANISSTNKIKIYDIKILYNQDTIEIDNPEYIKLNKKLTELQNEINSSDKPTDKYDSIIVEIKKKLLETNEKIKKTDTVPKLECKYVTEKSKSFSTLYLRKKEKEELINLINVYKTNKQKLLDLGLPDKLGILLEGLAGTGKTSTIWTIATELDKDIYYVHLNTIKTNDQLTDVFNYVNNETNGGIIVFEDIDAMTNIVLQRTSETTNSELTFGHLLNLLQGTLTKDGTMFIITTNHIKHLDAALYRDGRFDLIIQMKNADHHQCSEIFNTFFGRSLEEELLKMLPEDVFTPAKFIFFLSKQIWNVHISNEELIKEFLKIL